VVSAAAESLDRLRLELEKRFGTALRPLPGAAPAPERGGFRVGVRALDQLLPQGVPRAAASLWTGPPGSGRTAAVRALVRAACREGLVALVDATRTLDAAAWCEAGGQSAPGVWVARPPAAGHEHEGAWVAEALLRTGAFGLVVLDGPVPEPTEAYRLRALARECDAALLVSSASGGSGWRADVRLDFAWGESDQGGLLHGGRFRRPAQVRLVKQPGALPAQRQVELVHEPPRREQALAFAPDRRPGAGGWELGGEA
jgi:hypothetical protein